MTFPALEEEIVKNSIEQSKNDDNLPKEENASKYNLTEEQEQEHRVKDMLLYVNAPIDRNSMDKLEYKNKLKEHYTRSNNYWDRFKTPLWKPQFSKEEENQLKVAEENYDKLINDSTTDFSQQAFEVQEAKEISKIAYKENFLDIMNQPDSLRMNRINKMVKERSKLKMPSSFPNDAREQMKVPSYPLNSGTERKEEIVNEQGQAKPAAYSPMTNNKDMTGAVESLNEASSLGTKNKVYLDSSNSSQTNSAHKKDEKMPEKEYNHISSSQKPAADRPRSLLGNALSRSKTHQQSKSVNKELLTRPQQVEYKANNPVDYSDQKEYTPSRSDIRQKMNQLHSLEQKLRNNLASATNVSEIQKLQQMYINQLTQVQRDAATYYKDQWWISEEDEDIMAEAAEFPSYFEGLNTSRAQQEQLNYSSRYASARIGENIYIKYRDKIKNGADFAAGFSEGALFGQGERIARLAHGDDAPWADSESKWYKGGEIAGIAATSFVPVKGGQAIRAGKELGTKNFRVAPLGNATNHAIGKYPHYHRRSRDSSDNTKPGQGIGRHRPWEKKSTDKRFGDRF